MAGGGLREKKRDHKNYEMWEFMRLPRPPPSLQYRFSISAPFFLFAGKAFLYTVLRTWENAILATERTVGWGASVYRKERK